MTHRWLILVLTACILALCMQAVEAQELELKGMLFPREGSLLEISLGYAQDPQALPGHGLYGAG